MHGERPVALLADLGLLAPGTVLAHAVHRDDAELVAVVAGGAAVAHCPASNLKLASGVAPVVEMLDTGLDPVRLVAAAPEGLGSRLGSLGRPVVVASEFETLTRRFVSERGWPFVFIRTYGATEVFPPEDADLVLDLTATGTTLRENLGLPKPQLH
jgi:hypothetical protein